MCIGVPPNSFCGKKCSIFKAGLVPLSKRLENMEDSITYCMEKYDNFETTLGSTQNICRNQSYNNMCKNVCEEAKMISREYSKLQFEVISCSKGYSNETKEHPLIHFSNWSGVPSDTYIDIDEPTDKKRHSTRN